MHEFVENVIVVDVVRFIIRNILEELRDMEQDRMLKKRMSFVVGTSTFVVSVFLSSVQYEARLAGLTLTHESLFCAE